MFYRTGAQSRKLQDTSRILQNEQNMRMDREPSNDRLAKKIICIFYSVPVDDFCPSPYCT